jgi:tRNA (adenine22-N1)-methyltransferase
MDNQIHNKGVEMELTGRLKLIAEKVPYCEIVCDIGTDHAYLPIYLIEKKVCKKAVATDVKTGPVNVAVENIKKAGLDKAIDTRMGNGLEKVKEAETEAIIIAGMGGILIKNILEQGFEKAKSARALILQPMNAIEILREWLYKNGFYIYDEELVSEVEKIYVVISAKWNSEHTPHEEIDYYIGRKLIEKRDPLLERYISKRLRILKEIVNEIEASDTQKVEIKNKYTKLRDNLVKILALLNKTNF